ncbi:hypothetical protein NESM_000050700 [Novymonas esmeraldas]|uniref:Uncharacterized protein n=1 Tax=Novymonas esmeraldas TaxID=1808958 RepID=A0AAW0F323_9TRYP
MQEEFVTRAKFKALTAVEVLIATCTIFADDVGDGRLKMMAWLLHRQVAEQASAHNLALGNRMYGGKAVLHSASIVATQQPLHPTRQRDILNYQVLEEAHAMRAGPWSSPRDPFLPSFSFIHNTETAPLLGGGNAPVYGSDGQQSAAMDVTAVKAVKQSLVHIRKTLANVGEKVSRRSQKKATGSPKKPTV